MDGWMDRWWRGGIKNPAAEFYQKQKRDDSRMSERFASYERATSKFRKFSIFPFESVRTDKIVSL